MATENASRLKATTAIDDSNKIIMKKMFSYRSEKYRINRSSSCLIIKWSHCHHSDIGTINRAIIIVVIHTTSSNLALGLSSVDHGSLIAIEV